MRVCVSARACVLVRVRKKEFVGVVINGLSYITKIKHTMNKPKKGKKLTNQCQKCPPFRKKASERRRAGAEGTLCVCMRRGGGLYGAESRVSLSQTESI